MNSRVSLVSLLAVFALAGCSDDPGGVGTPCAEKEECAEGLACDVHDGAGTCQEPHEHADDEPTDEAEHDHSEHEH